MVILQRTGDDFARRCRAFIDQHDQRHRLHRIGQLAQRVRAAAAQVELGRGLEGRLRFGDLSVRGHDHGVARQEGRGHRDRCFEQAAGIVAQVEHEALQVRVLLVDVFELLREVGVRVVHEAAREALLGVVLLLVLRRLLLDREDVDDVHALGHVRLLDLLHPVRVRLAVRARGAVDDVERRLLHGAGVELERAALGTVAEDRVRVAGDQAPDLGAAFLLRGRSS